MAPATAPAWWCAPDANGPFDNNHLDTFVTECQKHIALQDAMPDRIPKLKKVLIGPVSIYYTGDGAKLACVTCTIIERVYIVQFDPYMGTADQWMAAMLGVCVSKWPRPASTTATSMSAIWSTRTTTAPSCWTLVWSRVFEGVRINPGQRHAIRPPGTD